MLSTPRVEKPGRNYRVVPEVELIEATGFANYLDDFVATIEDFQKDHDLADGSYIIQRPGVKALMAESSISSVAIRPASTDPITGNLLRFGGNALSRYNAPKLSIGRLSFWEDWNKTNATVYAYVDGVNTVSPVNSINFLSPNWYPRSKTVNGKITRVKDEEEIVPDLVVWGTGSKGCFELTIPKSDFKPISSFEGEVLFQGAANVISVLDQGSGFEPDGTMAVLHYPHEPIAYWTFDIHESLFDDVNQSRFQPSPAWLRNIKRKLANHWSFEEEDGIYIFDEITDNNISIGPDFNMSDDSRWEWGTRGRALEFNGSNGISFENMIHEDLNFTFSSWLNPYDDFTLTIGGQEVDYIHATGELTFNNDTNQVLQKQSMDNQWMHFAFVQFKPLKAYIYLDGQRISVDSSINKGVNTDIDLLNYNGLLDEVQYFEASFKPPMIKELAGRVFLDLSGNKLHAVPIGDDLPLHNPTGDPGMSTDRPTWE